MIVKIYINVIGVKNERYFASIEQAVVYLNGFVKKLGMDADKCSITHLSKNTLKNLCQDLDEFIPCKSPKGAEISYTLLNPAEVAASVCGRVLAIEDEQLLIDIANEVNMKLNL